MPQPRLTSELALLSRRISEAMRPLVEWQRQTSARLGAAIQQYEPLIREYAPLIREWVEELQRGLERALPPNWRGFEARQVMAASRLMVEQGINIAWVPRREIVEELLAAPDLTERDLVLSGREADILDDLADCLTAIEQNPLRAAQDALQEAVEVFRAGHHRAAQALTAVTLASIAQEVMGHNKLTDAWKAFAPLHPQEAPIQQFRLKAVLRCVAHALTHTDIAGPGFNRHASVHGLSSEQYTRVNALAGLMLVTGLARELDFWLRQEEAADAEHSALST